MAKTGAVLAFVALLFCARTSLAEAPSVEKCLQSSESAQRLRDEGKFVRARELFMTCAAKSCPPVVQRECATSLAEVERSTPSVVFSIRDDAGQDVTTARLFVDDAPVERPLGTPIPLDAGEHRLRAEASGHRTTELRFIASTGEKNRVFAVRMTRERDVLRSAPPPREPTPSEPGLSGRRVTALTFGGLALFGGAASVLLGTGARSDLNDLRGAPCASTRTCAQSDVSSVETRLTFADIALGASVVAAAAAIWLWFSDNHAASF